MTKTRYIVRQRNGGFWLDYRTEKGDTFTSRFLAPIRIGSSHAHDMALYYIVSQSQLPFGV